VFVGRVERFEDLIAWQKARLLTRAVYQLTKQRTLARDYKLSGQMQEAAVSVMGNIAEGFERSRPGEFHQFLSVAKSSCAELRSHLYAACEADHIDQATLNQMLAQAEEVARVIGGLRASVERRRVSEVPAEYSALSTQHSALDDWDADE
jgi:four helix bundle protein